MISKEFLLEKYVSEGKSTYEIAKELNCKAPTVRKYLIKYDIPRRHGKECFPVLDIIGKQFGDLEVIRYLGNDNNKHRSFLCRCKCGREVKIYHSRLIKKGTKRCYECRRKISGKEHGLRKGYKEISGNIWGKIRSCAKNAGKTFDISIEYAYSVLEKQNFKCNISGLDLYIAQSTREYESGLHTASLDRIDSSKGYIEGNVQWLHKFVNIMKWNHNQDEFIKICHIISDYQRGKNG